MINGRDRISSHQYLENQSKPCSHCFTVSSKARESFRSELSFWATGRTHAMRPSGLGGRRRIAGNEDAAPPVHEVLQVSYQYRIISQP